MTGNFTTTRDYKKRHLITQRIKRGKLHGQWSVNRIYVYSLMEINVRFFRRTLLPINQNPNEKNFSEKSFLPLQMKR